MLAVNIPMSVKQVASYNSNVSAALPGMVYQGNGIWSYPNTTTNINAQGPGQPGVPQMVRQVGDMGDLTTGEATVTLNAPTKEEHTQLRAEVDRLTQIVKQQNDDIIQLFSELQKMQRVLHATATRQSAASGLPGYWEET